MSSEISTKSDPGIQPWQFFTIAALGCATAAVFFARGQGTAVVVLLSVLMAGTALVGIAALRAVRPLFGPEVDRTPMIGRRTRVAMEREKLLTLRAIKELEFDHAMGKLSDADWGEMTGRLRSRAAGLMRQLDASHGYREQIERDFMKRLGQKPGSVQSTTDLTSLTPSRSERVCGACSVANDADARFCKSCGQRL